MMKKFTRIEPTTQQSFGLQYKKVALIKRFQTEDGKLHEFTTFYKQGDHAAAIIALTTDRKVIITYQFRAGPERWMYDIPGGGVEKGEEPQAGALRELKEETGYEPGHIEFLGTNSRDAYSNGVWYYYFVTDAVPVSEGRSLDEEEQDQGAEVRFISIAEFLEHAKHDRMTDPAAVLMAYDRLKEIERGSK